MPGTCITVLLKLHRLNDWVHIGTTYAWHMHHDLAGTAYYDLLDLMIGCMVLSELLSS